MFFFPVVVMNLCSFVCWCICKIITERDGGQEEFKLWL